MTPQEPPAPARPPGVQVGSGTLYCEACGTETPHRILKLVAGREGTNAPTRGIARCQRCRWTHPFEMAVKRRVAVDVIVSVGARSERHRLEFPLGSSAEVGADLAASAGPLWVRKIEARNGTTPSQASLTDVAVLWVVRGSGSEVPVSIVEGGRTVPSRLATSPDQLLGVGEECTTKDGRVVIVAIRARGHTWHRPGDQFSAKEVTRLYAQRTANPPAGRSDWTSGRGMPSSRASSASRPGRSRSGPGVRMKRTVPRRRTASGGAAVHSVSPSYSINPIASSVGRSRK